MANDLTPHHPVMVAQEALNVLRANAVLAGLVYRDFEDEVKTMGDTVQVPVIGALSASNKAIGSDYTIADATSTKVDVVLNKHKHATFIVEDIEKAFARGDVIGAYGKSAMAAIVDAVDADIAGLYSGLSQTQGADGTAIDAAGMRTARKTLSDAKAPQSDRYFVAGTEAYTQLLGEAEFTSVEKYGASTPVMEGELGKIYGFRVFENQNIVTATGDHNLAFHKHAFGLAVRPLPAAPAGMGVQSAVVSDPISGLSVRVLMSYNARRGGVETTVEILYGVAELRDTLAVDVIT